MRWCKDINYTLEYSSDQLLITLLLLQQAKSRSRGEVKAIDKNKLALEK